MSKGEKTQAAVVDAALDHAIRVGLEGVSIGGLASALGMSKSGLFGHFKSKEALQLAVLDEAIERFRQGVISPALSETTPMARLRSLFEHHLDWIEGKCGVEGCPFAGFVQEFDAREGALRDRLAASQAYWLDLLAETILQAVAGASPSGARQGAFELHGVALAFQVEVKLQRNAEARPSAMTAYERIISSLSPEGG